MFAKYLQADVNSRFNHEQNPSLYFTINFNRGKSLDLLYQ